MPRSQRCLLSTKVVAKREAAAAQWTKRAEQIQAGERQNLWDFFKERGYVKDTVGTDEQIGRIMRDKRIGAYVGIDPTASSLHVGHLLPLMPLFWMYMNGYRAVTVIGGATAKIGDPTGRLQDREDLAAVDARANVTKVHYQVKRLWLNVDACARRFKYQKEWSWERSLANNSTWYNSTSFMEVVQRLFSGLRLGPLLSRDMVKRRLDSKEGMPLDEFVYPLCQAWDWWHLYSCPRPVQMQIGGSDQYGNILTGIEAIKHLRATEPDPAKRIPDTPLNTPIGFTVPLLTDSSGAKFGKSAGNAVWLDPFLTSSFDLYKYFVRQPDADVEKLLRLLTFLPSNDISRIMDRQNKEPAKRHAHHTLAYEIVAMVHSPEAAAEAQQQHVALHTKRPTSSIQLDMYPTDKPASNTTALGFKPDLELPESLIFGKSIARILYAAGLASSASDGQRLTSSQGAYVGGRPGGSYATEEVTFMPVKTWTSAETKKFLIDDKLLILRRGKHFIRIVKVVPDEQWKQSGQTYPGEPGSGAFRKLLNAYKDAAGNSRHVNAQAMRHFRQDMENLEALQSPEAESEVMYPEGVPPNKRTPQDIHRGNKIEEVLGDKRDK